MRTLHLLYHELRIEQTGYSYVTTAEEFRSHCLLYARLQGAVAGALLRPEVTFDDGHRSDATLALPLLREHGLRATFFITAGWTGERSGYMDWSDLRKLRAEGHTIGAHGMTHKLLTACSDAELSEELEGAKRKLEDGLGSEVHTMSLPGGRANARVLRACEAAGFHQVFTSVPQAIAVDAAPRVVGRLNLHGGTTVAWLERVLDPATDALKMLERADRFKGVAKRVLGDRIYARLWAAANRQEPAITDGGAWRS